MHSQLGQDDFVLEKVGKQGFFVEVGASHAENYSNSLGLEGEGWTGICVDPLIDDEQYDKWERTCIRDKRAVYTYNGVVKFTEVDMDGGVLSAISDYIDIPDEFHAVRQGGTETEVPCATLHDLLEGHNAPPYIDYLSIDTEGSELDILQAYDWGRLFGIITIEHNCHRPGTSRKYLDDITTFLRGCGYTWMREVKWDAWFVHKNLEKSG